MKKVEAYHIDPPGKSPDERVVFLKSGFDHAWIVVVEDSAYNLSADYATEDEVKLLKLLTGGN